jgi:hypothetical protein
MRNQCQRRWEKGGKTLSDLTAIRLEGTSGSKLGQETLRPKLITQLESFLSQTLEKFIASLKSLVLTRALVLETHFHLFSLHISSTVRIQQVYVFPNSQPNNDALASPSSRWLLNRAKTLSTSPSSPSKLSVMKVCFDRIASPHRTRAHDVRALPTEMVENMKRVASSDQELTVEERNLLSVAYKNVIGARRASWRIVSSIEQKEESKGNEAQVSMIKGYREKIEGELAKICEDILEVLDKHLIPSAASGESKVFYHKMYFNLNLLLIPLPNVFTDFSPIL